MFATARRVSRLARVGRVLAAHDHLWPEQLGPVPPWLALAGRASRLMSGEQKSSASPAHLALALESLGPAYIKLGQILATRPDIVGPVIASALASLQDRLAPFADSEARAIVAAELGAPLEALFESFGGPVAAASIAQVHRAETRAGLGHNRAPVAPPISRTPANDDAKMLTPQPVAVKVLRPNIERAFAADLDAFFWSARLIEKFSSAARRLEPLKLVKTLSDSVALELDLRLEGAAAVELANNMRGDPGFRVPRIDWSRTSRRVLTLEWIDGVPISERDRLAAAGHDCVKIATTLMQSFLTQALRDGYFHADLHQGNVFVDAEGGIVVVDFGIMGRLDAASRRYLADILYGFLRRDYKRIAEVHFEAGYVPGRHSVEAFAQALCAIGEPIFGRNAADISMARLLSQLFETTAMFDMHLRPELVLLQKTMVVVEGVARRLDPEHNLWEAARPVIERFMQRELGPEARLQNAAGHAAALGRVLGDLPAFLKTVERAASAYAERGLALDPASVEALGRAEARAGRAERIALGLGGLAIVVVLLILL